MCTTSTVALGRGEYEAQGRTVTYKDIYGTHIFNNWTTEIFKESHVHYFNQGQFLLKKHLELLTLQTCSAGDSQ